MELKRHEHSKRKVESDISETSRKITRQSPGCSTSTMTQDCFFCGGTSGELHKVSTFSIDSNIRKYALQVQDTVLLAKLSAGDMISQEAMYHKNCYLNFFNKARPQKIVDENGENQIHGIVLAELVSFVKDSRMNKGVAAVFRLTDLMAMYSNRLEQFGLDMNKRPNSTHVKDRILAAIPDLQAHKQGREIESPLFNFWSLTLKFEIAILVFIRSPREGNFQLYKESISLLIPWFFALDHPNYARWLPVYLRDMVMLHDNAPEVEKEFQNGKFVAKKSHNRFSSIALDQAHEQNN